MTRPADTSSDLIQEWIEERIGNPQLAEQLPHDRTDPLVQLFAAAASERPVLSPDEAERILAGILASVRSDRRSRPRPAPWWQLAVSVLAVAAALAAVVTASRREPRPATPGVLIKEVVFESTRDNKTVSLELRLYRTEASDVPSPQS